MSINLSDRFVCCLTSGVFAFSLCGCSNNENDKGSSSVSSFVSSMETTSSSTSTISTSTAPITTITSTTLTTTVLTSSYSNSIVYTDNDLFVIDYFHRLGDEVKNNFNSDDLKEKGKLYFICCVDFLFYDGKINGISFNDLNDTAKQQLLNDICTIDELICTRFPDYKEDISDNMGSFYDNAMDLIRLGRDNINDFSREKLGDENYEKIQSYFDLFKEQTVNDLNDLNDLFDTGKSKVKSWYEGYRDGR